MAMLNNQRVHEFTTSSGFCWGIDHITLESKGPYSSNSLPTRKKKRPADCVDVPPNFLLA